MNTIWLIVWGIALALIAYLTIRLFIRDRRFRIVAKALAKAYNDLTQANQEIRQNAERKSAFLASMSHELRTPITAIKGYVDNMRDGFAGELTEKQRHNLARVSQNTAHLLRLIDNLLDLSKIEAGRMDIHKTYFDIEHMATHCLSIVRSLVKKGVTLSCHISPDVGQVCTDEMGLRQILINLLGNAIKFTDEGSVTLSAAIEHDMLVLSVTDTGKGIPKDELPFIFDEYRQVKGSESSVQKGTGLGLSITKKFAELLGGTIGVESEVGKGTTFTVRIPVQYEGKT